MVQERLPEPATVVEPNTRAYLEELIRVLRFNFDNSEVALDEGLGNIDTDSIAEGSTNLYYTDERVDDRVDSLLQEGVGIDLTYDDVLNTLEIAAELASQAEAEAGTINDKLMTPLRVSQFLDANVPSVGWNLVETITASNIPAVEFETGIDNTGDVYVFVGSGITPTTDNVNLGIQVSQDGGATYDTGASNYTYGGVFVGQSAGVTDNRSAGDDIIELSLLGTGNASDETMNFVIYMFDPSNAGTDTQFAGITTHLNQGGQVEFQGFSGKRNANQLTDAVRFLFTSGNVSVGQVSLYRLGN